MKIDLRIDEKKRKGIALQSKSLLPQKKLTILLEIVFRSPGRKNKYYIQFSQPDRETCKTNYVCFCFPFWLSWSDREEYLNTEYFVQLFTIFNRFNHFKGISAEVSRSIQSGYLIYMKNFLPKRANFHPPTCFHFFQLQSRENLKSIRPYIHV